MKKYGILLLLPLLLTGCSEPKAFETMSDVYLQPDTPAASQIVLELPEEAAAPAMTSEVGGSLYLCDGYSMIVQTLSSGDLDATLRQTTGYSRDKLQVLERGTEACKRYECVWAAAGEGEDQIGRAVILDDGEYHYVLSVMAGSSVAGELAQTWQRIIDSFSLRTAP